MRQHTRARIAFPVAIVAVALMSIPLAGQFGGQFSEGFELTVTQDRLINAQDEPQNWLLMNGDYGSQRYSKLTQINRDNVDNLRMVWALALGGMIGTGANGPENEVNPLIDNGFMYATDGWGTVYKIDARNPNYGEFVWMTDPGVDQEVNRPRTRGIALWEDKVLQNLQDGRVLALDRDDGEILWDVEVAGTNEFGSRERFLTAPIVADGRMLVQNGAGDGGTRGWVAALDVDTGEELWRWYTVPAPGEPGSETWKDDNNAWKTGGGGVWQTGSYDPANNLYIFGTGNPYPIYDVEYRPGDNLYTNSAVALDVATGERRWHFQYTPNDSWDYDEVGVHMLYDTVINGEERQVVAHFARNGFLLFARPRDRRVHQGGPVRQRAYLDGRAESGDRQAAGVRPEPRHSDLQRGGARAPARPRPDEARLPDVARRHCASADRVQSGTRGSLTAPARRDVSRRPAHRSSRSARTAASTGRRASSGTTRVISTTARLPRWTPIRTRCSPRR